MKQQTFSVLFFIRKTRLLKTGEAPINMRITVDGRYVEMQTQRRVLPPNWNQQKERATANWTSKLYLHKKLSRNFV